MASFVSHFTLFSFNRKDIKEKKVVFIACNYILNIILIIIYFKIAKKDK